MPTKMHKITKTFIFISIFLGFLENVSILIYNPIIDHITQQNGLIGIDAAKFYYINPYRYIFNIPFQIWILVAILSIITTLSISNSRKKKDFWLLILTHIVVLLFPMFSLSFVEQPTVPFAW